MEGLIYGLCIVGLLLMFVGFKLLEENDKLNRKLASLEAWYIFSLRMRVRMVPTDSIIRIM